MINFIFNRKRWSPFHKILMTSLSLGSCTSKLMSGYNRAFPLMGSDVGEHDYLVNSANSLQKVIKEQDKVVVVFFYRSGCPYCRVYAPEFAKLAQGYRGAQIIFTSIGLSNDVDKRTSQKKEIAAAYGVTIETFPCLVIFWRQTIEAVIQGDPKGRSLPVMRKRLDALLTKN